MPQSATHLLVSNLEERCHHIPVGDVISHLLTRVGSVQQVAFAFEFVDIAQWLAQLAAIGFQTPRCGGTAAAAAFHRAILGATKHPHVRVFDNRVAAFALHCSVSCRTIRGVWTGSQLERSRAATASSRHDIASAISNVSPTVLISSTPV